MQDCSSGYASVNGLKMYYEIHGTGLPLVLIHGGGSTIQTSFGRVLHSFAREATSAGPPKPYEKPVAASKS